MGPALRIAELASEFASSGRYHDRTICPECSVNRRNHNDRCLSLTLADNAVLYCCHHCDFSGSVRSDGSVSVGVAPSPKPILMDIRIDPLSSVAMEWLASRGISAVAIEAGRLGETDKWFNGNGLQKAVVFPYHDLEGNLIGSKYRAIAEKEFKAEANSKSTLWGLSQQFNADKPLIITEGEMDALSFMEAGIPNAVSVPSGAPAKIGQDNGRRLSWLNDLEDWVKQFPSYILATDSDEPGKALREELARRLGRSKCYSLEYPEGCKDANDVLVKRSKISLLAITTRAEPLPVSGLFSPMHYFDEFMELCSSDGKGFSTGFEQIDNLFTVAPGQLSVVTGIPSSGKSNFIDQLCLNLVNQYSWPIAIASMENPPVSHIAKLSTMQFGRTPFAGEPNSMNATERKQAVEWCAESFQFIDLQRSSESVTIDALLDRAQAAIFRTGIKGLVVDPYNYIEQDRGSSSETEWISKVLSRLAAFAKANQIHIWFVAHPSKPMKSFGSEPKAPDGYDISGSAHWYNKADVGITVHRHDSEGPGIVEIRCWKCRFAWTGQQGTTKLQWRRDDFTYHSVDGFGF